MTFQFEGKLVGPWVREAEQCLRHTRTGRPKASHRFDLTGVTLIDDAGLGQFNLERLVARAIQ